MTVRTYPSGFYLGEYHTASVERKIDCSEADSVNITAMGNTSDVDFMFELGGIISGTVYESDAATPIADLIVYIYEDKCLEGSVIGATTNNLGEFTITGVPAGKFYIFASGNLSEYDGSKYSIVKGAYNAE